MKQGPRLLWNIATNYAREVLLALISLVINPFMFHRLGEVGYGVIALTGSTTGLLRLLDLGLAHAVSRFVGRAAALHDQDEINRVVSTAMAVYAGLGILAMGITAGVGWWFAGPLGIPGEVSEPARWVFLLTGISIAIRFPGNALEGALRALQRFDLANGALVVDRVVYALAVGLALGLMEKGIISAAVCLIVGTTASQVVRVMGTKAACPDLRIGARWMSATAARRMFGFGAWASLTQISSFLEQTAFRFILSAALTSTVVGVYHLVMVVVGTLRQMLIGVTSVIMPVASKYEALNEKERMRRLLIDGSKLVMAVSMPAAVWIAVMAEPILQTWVGPKMVPWSGLLTWMTLVSAVEMLTGSGNMVLMGAGRVNRMGMAYTVSSVAACVVLAVLLAFTSMGLYASVVALGVGILIRRAVITSEMCRFVGVTVWAYTVEVISPGLRCAAITLLALILARERLFGPDWGSLIVSAALTVVVHGAGTWWIVLDPARRGMVWAWVRGK